YVRSKTDYDGFLSVPPFTFGDTNQSSRSKEINGGVLARYKVLDGRLDNVVSVSRGDIERRDRTDEVPSFNADATRDNYRYQGTFKPVDMATIAFGAEREETKIKTASLGFFGSQSGGDSSIDSLFVLGEVKPVDTLTLSGGVRYDDHDEFGSKTTGRVGANWRPVEMLELRGSWGQGFKAPTIYQLVGDNSGFVNPNPDLKPEEADGWDAAATLWALDNALSLEVGYFDLNTKNLITYVFSGRYENVAKASTKGVEATLSYAVNETLKLSGNYTYTDAKDAMANTRLIRVPKHAGFAEVDWKATGKLGLTLTARYNGKEGDVDPSSFAAVENKSYTRLDLAARYALTDVLEMFGRVENLTDENYQDVAGYGTPGTSLYGGLRVRFQ
ncbi:MAG: TonB-dependent receptor, partial [Caulobacterales bacterium]